MINIDDWDGFVYIVRDGDMNIDRVFKNKSEADRYAKANGLRVVASRVTGFSR